MRQEKTLRISCAVALLVAGLIETKPAAAVDDPYGFALAPIGAAAGVTGGSATKLVRVTNLNNSGVGSLREAAAKGGSTIVFAVSGKIILSSAISVAANMTIDGRGADITILGKGLIITTTNVIVRNIKMAGNATTTSNDDAIGIQGGASGVWIDHLDLTAFKDGLVDATQLATNVTISYTKFYDHGKTSLLGSNVEIGTPALVDMTIHHNWYFRTGERNPYMRQGRFHVFNNLVEAWGYSSDSGYGTRSGCGALVRAENNVYITSGERRALSVSKSNCDPTRPPALRSPGNLLGGLPLVEYNPTLVPVFPADVPYVEAATSALATKLRTQAGWKNVPNPLLLR